jgi:hypothetical protein
MFTQSLAHNEGSKILTDRNGKGRQSGNRREKKTTREE